VVVTAGLRFDYNTMTDDFLSPRLAAVFQPAQGQYFRLGAARAFRKPVFIETSLHPLVSFPDDSPIKGPAQERFLEFMTRVFGNSELENEVLWAFEVGYLGEFLGGKLRISLDLYYNLYSNEIQLEPGLVENDLGLPDLDLSSYRFANTGRDIDVLGGELSIRYSPVRSVTVMASWGHREIFDRATGRVSGASPKNLLTLGGRFETDWGLIGSLYAFSRSEFWDEGVDNPSGPLEGRLYQHLDNVILFMGKLGWRTRILTSIELEAGIGLFLPASLSSPHAFSYYEKGGGISSTGQPYGGEALRRRVTTYLQGQF
jgi:outer membrane receptor protein involved in Fe transport